MPSFIKTSIGRTFHQISLPKFTQTIHPKCLAWPKDQGMAPQSQVPEEEENGSGDRKRDGDGRGRKSGQGGCLPKALSIRAI